MRVAVIGAGVAGLVCAYRLGQEGHTTDVYERWPGLGGQAATIPVGGGHLLERYYHHLFTSDRHIAELYEELGMPDELEWRPSSMAFFLEGRSWPFTTPLHLLRFGPLSPVSRARMGFAVLRLQRTARDVGPFERMTARAWIRGAMGEQPYEKIWGPLLRGKFGDRAAEGFEVTAAAPGAFRTGHDPTRYEQAGSERYDAVVATVPNDVFAALLD